MAAVKLPPVGADDLLRVFPRYRQSLLGTADNCMLAARFEIEGYSYTNAAQARGILFHAYAGRLLQTLQETGQTKIPTAEALEILYEVCRQDDVPDEDVVALSMVERRYLRICAVMLAQVEFQHMHRLLAVERRLFATITYDSPIWHDCPDCREGDSGCATCRDARVLEGPGKLTREITGQPDAMLADPPDGAVVVDWKTTRAAPPKWTGRGRDPAEDDGGDPAHVSYEGYFQQRFYALLMMRNYPSVQAVTLREYYVMPRESREATVRRGALEHIEREIADIVALLDRAIHEGRGSGLWQPSPGKHCSYCRAASRCPIEREARVREGGISSAAEAARVAAEFVVADQVRDETRGALKAYYERTGQPIPVRAAKGRYELRKEDGTSGNFGMFVPERSDRGPGDPALDEVFDEVKQRKAAA